MKDKLNYRYETIEIEDYDIHIRSLRDIQQFQDLDGKVAEANISDTQWPISGVLWPSGIVLAKIMAKKELHQLKILEVGCGLALASIVLKVRGKNITATDNNPSVAKFLQENIRINQCSSIPFKLIEWKHIKSSAEELYDLIIGGDVLYERQLPDELCNFILKNAKQKCEVIIVDPNRGNLSVFTKMMQENNFLHLKDNQNHFDK